MGKLHSRANFLRHIVRHRGHTASRKVLALRTALELEAQRCRLGLRCLIGPLAVEDCAALYFIRAARVADLVAFAAIRSRIPAVEGPASLACRHPCQSDPLTFVESFDLTGYSDIVRLLCAYEFIFDFIVVLECRIGVRERIRIFLIIRQKINMPLDDVIGRTIRIWCGNIDIPARDSHGNIANLGFSYRIFKRCAVRILHRNLNRGGPWRRFHDLASGVDLAV